MRMRIREAVLGTLTMHRVASPGIARHRPASPAIACHRRRCCRLDGGNPRTSIILVWHRRASRGIACHRRGIAWHRRGIAVASRGIAWHRLAIRLCRRMSQLSRGCGTSNHKHNQRGAFITCLQGHKSRVMTRPFMEQAMFEQRLYMLELLHPGQDAGGETVPERHVAAGVHM